jgi:membrane protein YqaA with SNARE-associated domain
VWLLALTFGFSVASALIPVLNVEAYLAVAASDSTAPTLLLVGAAAVGQMVGKVVWYYAGDRLDRVPWLRKKMAKDSWQASVERWRTRTEGRPWTTAALLFTSSLTGLPPFAVVSVVAGLLRTRIEVFVLAGLAGRFLRFWIVLEAARYAWLLA